MTNYDYTEKPKNSDYDYDEKPKNSDVPLADVGNRFIALIIDGVILSALGGVFSGGRGEVGGAIAFGVGLLYYGFMLTQNNGQSVGKMLMGVRVVKANGQPLTLTDVIIRYLGYYLNSFVFGLGWIWAFFDKDHQGWHDKLAGTYVVAAKR